MKSEDGNLDLAVVPPRSLGGSGAPGTNPEQLFAAGYAACFGSAINFIARREKLTTGPVAVTAHVSIGPTGRGFGLAVELEVHVPELPPAQAEALLRAAHETCPYSNATRGNIAVELRLV